jgi:hypothetical protein
MIRANGDRLPIVPEIFIFAATLSYLLWGREQSGRNVKLTTRLHVVLKCILRGALSPFPHMCSSMILQMATRWAPNK